MRAPLLLLLNGFDADAAAWKRAVAANGGSVGVPTLRAVNGFCKSAKAYGLWTKITRANLFCGDQLAAALVPLKATVGNSTETGSGLVEADYVETGATAGIKGNGSNKYMDTGWNVSGGSNTNMGLWAYVKGTESGASNKFILGAASTGNLTQLGWGLAGTSEIGCISASGTTDQPPGAAAASKEGFLGVAVNGSRDQQYYQNGAAVGSTIAATGGFANRSLYILCNNLAGTASNFSTRYVRAYVVTTGMSATDAANLNTIMQTFQSALSRNV